MFTFPALLWFLPILGAVLLIHLINMFRHRRVHWAAMEFILASYKKSRTRILLQQLLLLLLRTAAIGLIILMFAEPKLSGKLLQYFGNTGTHHIVLLDDSYSMDERNLSQGGTPLFNEAIAIVQKIADGQPNDRFSLLKLSDTTPLLHELPMSPENQQTIQNALEQLEPSSLAADPLTIFDSAEKLLQQTSVRKSVLYFLSDFRQRNWENPEAVRKQIEMVRNHGGTVRMIRFAQPEQPNLTMEPLQLVEGIHAADVDLLIDATVVNHSSIAAENVLVTLFVNEEMRSQQMIPRLQPQSKTEPPLRFPVRLSSQQPQRIEVRLQPDALPEDNSQFLVINVPDALEVLLISTTEDLGSSAPFVRAALSPGGLKSGIRIRQESPSFLVDKPLESFSAIFVLDLPNLEPSAIRGLETYVANGGGVAFFSGQKTDLDFVRTHLFKSGTGLFPVEPTGVQELLPDYLSKATDLRISPHPIFRLFNEGESPLLAGVIIDRYLTAAPITQTEVRVWATLRNGSPLVLEKSLGKGKTMTFLTTIAPTWNNWARNPGFVVVLLELTAWLAQRSESSQTYLAGDSLSASIDPSKFEERVLFIPPIREGELNVSETFIEAKRNESGTMIATFERANHPGIYGVQRRLRSGGEQLESIPVNVNSSEGNLRQSELGMLSDTLRNMGQSLESASGFNSLGTLDGQRSLSDWLLCMVLLFLIGETFLAGKILPPSRRY